MSHDAKIPLAEATRTLEPLDARARILWAVTSFGSDVVLLSSMQKTGVVLMHMFHELGLANEVLFIDTGYHFIETLKLRDEYMRRFRLNLVTLYPKTTIEDQEAKFGKKLFSCADGQPQCCHMRKEAPLLDHLSGKSAPVLVGGLRRAEGGMRKRLQVLGDDPRTGGYQLSPILDWTAEEVESYLARHSLPVHPLYAKSYLSIGCYPCTTPVRPGEDARAGRWRHLRPPGSDEGPKYCNLNYSDGGGI